MFSTETIRAIERDFAEAGPRLEGRREQLFGVFGQASEEELLCLKYIYAYLPVSDAASYDGELFLKLTRDALYVRDHSPWGSKLTDIMFLNYVLSVRVNNEDLTDHRELIRRELEPRLVGLSMEEAALEVNVWCYEKATYQATDSRTVSPLTIMRRGFGRCGEESTFTVSALRSVGLPARQCYTPRWAHSDDNHAWVEVWTGDGWHYLGACEPEAALDKGWFSAPARRGMLIETRIFSGIWENEEIVRKGSGMVLLNVSDNYFRTARIKVHVRKDGEPLEGADVHFNVINYAEFSPLVTLKTDAEGRCELKTGRGDLFVRAMLGGSYVEGHASLVDGDTELTLDFKDAKKSEDASFFIHMHAPQPEFAEEPEVSTEAEAAMALRKAAAEQVRASYLQTFRPQPDKEGADLEPAAYRRAKLLADSLGNWEEIERFLDETESGLDTGIKLDILEALNYKDLSDITAELLVHHALAAEPFRSEYPTEVYNKSLLNPRIGMEVISGWRSLKDRFSAQEQEAFRMNPASIKDMVNSRIQDAGDYDYGTIMAEPNGLLELGIGSRLSRRILTVAIARSLGIPARINRVDYHLEYYQDKNWKRFTLDPASAGKEQQDEAELRSVRVSLKKSNPEETIEYGTHLSLARLDGDAVYRTLGLYRESFTDDHRFEAALEPGQYQLLVCSRLASGDSIARISRFPAAANQSVDLEISLPEDDTAEGESPHFEPLNLSAGRFKPEGEDSRLLAILAPGGEPTEHFMNELLENEDEVIKVSSRIKFVLPDEDSRANAKLQKVLETFPSIEAALPAEEVDMAAYLRRSFDAYSLHNRQYPLLVLLNPEGRVRLAISGYQVGSVSQLLAKF